MTIASIDIGTNTVLLLIARVNSKNGKIIPIRNEYRMPRIGQGTKNSGSIDSKKIKLLFNVLVDYHELIKQANCDKVILTGTNAFRMANNTLSIVKEIKNKFNYELNVISGEEEAEYAYHGAISDIENPGYSLVIDIGGSSTEIIAGEGRKIISKRSLQLGSVSGTEQFLPHSPPLKSEIANLISEIQKKFSKAELKEIPSQVIAIAGTATTLGCVILGLTVFNEDKVTDTKIDLQNLSKLIDEMSHLTSSEIILKYGEVMNGREDIIFAGLCILYQFMISYRIKEIKVSTRGIRYGAIVNYLKKISR